MAARSLEGHAVTLGADAAGGELGDAAAVEREEGLDLVLVLALGEQVADAAQVAEALFTDGADEQDVGLGLQAAGVEGADVLEQGGEARRIVADARRVEPRALARHLHVRPFREYGVEVGGGDDERAASRAPPHPEHVALRVDLDVLEAVGLEHVGVDLRALLFLEGRRLDLGELDHLADPAVVLAVEEFDGLLVALAAHDAPNHLVVRRRRRGRRGRRRRLSGGSGRGQGEAERQG